MKYACFIVFLFFGGTGIAGAGTESGGNSTYQTNVTLLPLVSYTPETSLMFGGLAMVQFKPPGSGIDTRSSRALLSGVYTLNRQVMFELTPSVILAEERWIFEGRYEYSFFPESYWGAGPETRSRDEWDIEYRKFAFEQIALRKFGDGWYSGPILRWDRLSDLEITGRSEQSEMSAIEEVSPETVTVDIDESLLPGIGWSLRKDHRNSMVTPTTGYYLEATTLFHPDLLGSTHSHSSWLLDARYYHNLRDGKYSVLAVHARSRFTSGDVPFQELSQLGGMKIMRGYYEGRFRDANAFQLQAEFRQHTWWRLGFTLFASAGEVWHRFEDVSASNPKYTAGAGLRFDLNPDDTSNIRLDYGIGPHGGGFYITIGEAF